MPASQLTYEERNDVSKIADSVQHFVEIKLWDGHKPVSELQEIFIDSINQQISSVPGNALAHIHNFLKNLHLLSGNINACIPCTLFLCMEI